MREKTTFFQNIIDLKKYSKVQITKSEALLRLGYIGRIAPEKNITSLVIAVQILINQGINIRLELYGEAYDREYLDIVKSEMSKSKSGNQIAIKPGCPDAREIYNKIDVLCLLSNYEGFSNVLSEGLSCGIPIIASDIPENKYIVEHLRNGYLVDPQNTESIICGIKYFCQMENNIYDEISKNNRIKAEKIFNVDNIYLKYSKLFKHLGLS